MKRISERVLEHSAYQKRLKELEAFEENRSFCKHDLKHFQEVGRIATLVAKENGLQVSSDLIMTASLLHDMGRVEQYKQGISHAEASVAFAREILLSLLVDENEIQCICEAIGKHSHRQCASKRFRDAYQLQTLSELLSYADQFSRKRYACSAFNECKWKKEEKILREYY